MNPPLLSLLAQAAGRQGRLDWVSPDEFVEKHVELARWSSGNALLVGAFFAALCLYAVVWFYRREARGHLSTPFRALLISCRAAVLILLGLIGLEPVVVNYVHRRISATTVVLVDDSASMSLVDGYRQPEDAARVAQLLDREPGDGVSRADIEQRLLTAGPAPLLQQLAQRNDVRVLRFSDRVDPLPLSLPNTRGAPAATSAPAAVHLDPAGPATDVGLAVRGALDSAGAAPIAAVVLLSDGDFNRGESTDDLARLLRQKGVPLHAVGIGDPAKPVNLAVTDVAGPRSVFKNDPFSVTVSLSAQNAGAEPLRVELLQRDAAGAAPAKVVATRNATAGPDGRIPPVVFQQKIAKPGTLLYSARVEPAPFESVLTDNQREILPPIEVLDTEIRALVVAGAPSYDYRYLVRLLERDATVNVSTWLQSADHRAVRDGDTIIKELPVAQEDLFKYDAILLFDPNPEEFPPTWGSLAAAFVSDHGGGLLVAAGNKYTSRFLQSANAASLVEILPVVPDPEAEILLNELGQYQTRAWPLLVPQQAASDPIIRLDDDPVANRDLWSSLEGVYWHFPIRREKPVATVLLRHSNPRMVNTFGPQVLLATQLVGAGRTAWLGLDSTWRWRRDDEALFNKFWIQMLRFLVEGKLLGPAGRGQIATPKDQFDQGESVSVTVRALDEHFEPLVAPQLDLNVASAGHDSPEKSTVALTPVIGREGYYQGRFLPHQSGAYRLSVTLKSPAGGPDAVLTRDVTVHPSQIEMKSTAMNRAALRRLALAAGGDFFEIDEAARLADRIPDASRMTIVRERPFPLWDNPACLSILVGLLILEWILRKKARLL